MATIQEFKQVIQILQNLREAGKIKRFQFTASESNALDFAIEFMQKSTEE